MTVAELRAALHDLCGFDAEEVVAADAPDEVTFAPRLVKPMFLDPDGITLSEDHARGGRGVIVLIP